MQALAWLRVLAILVAACCLAAGYSPARADDLDKAAAVRRIEEMNAKRLDEINAKIAKLNIPPRTVETLSEQGVRIRNQIRHGDFPAARQALSEVLANSKLSPWAFYPFSTVLRSILDAHDPDLEKKLSEWVATAPDDPLPLIVRAHLYRAVGWSKRGEKSASETSDSSLAAFRDDLRRALADTEAALKLDPSTPTLYVLKLMILSDQGFSPQLALAFTDAVAKYPDYLTLYKTMLTALQPKWGGSVKAMYRFVDTYAGKAPEDSPLKLLYLFLYAHLLDDAMVSCVGDNTDVGKWLNCMVTPMDENVTSDLQKHIAESLKLYDKLDHLQFGLTVREAVFEMFRIRGADAYFRPVLEQAAAAMHSDTNIDKIEDNPIAHGNFIVDELVAESYRDASPHDIAIMRLKEALLDIDKTDFAHEVDKYEEESWIYDKMAELSKLDRNKIDAIVYETAAQMLNKSTEHPALACEAYFIVRMYQEAIRSCGALVDYANDMDARNLRGKAYNMTGQWELALHDLTIVAEADADGVSRASAAMGIVQTYIFQNDFQSAVKTFGKFPVLFDPDVAGTAFVGTSYDNRCLAYMNIGELQRALADCTEALKYGWLPDAYQRQQELQQKLGKH